MLQTCLRRSRAALAVCSDMKLLVFPLSTRPISSLGYSGHSNRTRRFRCWEHWRKYSHDTQALDNRHVSEAVKDIYPPSLDLKQTTDSPTGRYLTGKSAVVTGSTSGIGLGIAEKLAERGANIILSGFGDQILIQRLQADISSKHGVTVQYLDANLSSVTEIEQLCQQVLYLYPHGIDILVNNAGLQHVSDVEKFPVEKWDLILAVMLSAPFHFTRLFLPLMRQKGWGRIINLASVHGLVASPLKSAYCSAKHGILGLTKVVALETAGSGVTCNAICPGFVNTPMFQSQVQTRAEQQSMSYEEAKDQFLETVHPTKGIVEISQVAEFVNFLCSNATDQMTGSILTMDSGWTAR